MPWAHLALVCRPESMTKTQLDLPLSLTTYPLHSLVYLLIVESKGLVTSWLSCSVANSAAGEAYKGKQGMQWALLALVRPPPRTLTILRNPSARVFGSGSINALLAPAHLNRLVRG